MRAKHTVSIRKIESENSSLRHIVVDRPRNFSFEPGQATLFHLTEEGSDEDASPFSPVSLKDADFLEFHIKIYPEREGLTDALDSYKEGDQIEISDPIGKISYEGPGTFLAAGTGITPFLSIFRNLPDRGELSMNHLYYTESEPEDLIAPELLLHLLGDHCHFVLTHVPENDPRHGRLDRTYLESKLTNFGDQYFYVCGPQDFTENTLNFLRQKGVPEEKLVFEGMDG